MVEALLRLPAAAIARLSSPLVTSALTLMAAFFTLDQSPLPY
jgi:hypothetical protein